MFLFLCFAFFGAVQASPVGKIIPVYEDSYDYRRHEDLRVSRNTLCFEDCHHHILNKPVFIVRSAQGAYSIHYAPLGLNGLTKSPLTAPLQEALLSTEDSVLAIFPFARFPFDLFPGLLDAELVVPEHATSLRHLYKEAPVVAVFPLEMLPKLKYWWQTSLLTQTALQWQRTLPSSTGMPNHKAINRDVTPVGQTAHLAAPADTVVLPVHGVRHSDIRIVDDSKKFIPYSPSSVGFYTIPVH